MWAPKPRWTWAEAWTSPWACCGCPPWRCSSGFTGRWRSRDRTRGDRRCTRASSKPVWPMASRPCWSRIRGCVRPAPGCWRPGPVRRVQPAAGLDQRPGQSAAAAPHPLSAAPGLRLDGGSAAGALRGRGGGGPVLPPGRPAAVPGLCPERHRSPLRQPHRLRRAPGAHRSGNPAAAGAAQHDGAAEPFGCGEFQLPSFFRGGAGCACQALRLAHGDRVPSVLLWE